ncbi:MAG: CPBP family intramembrane metalloprotease [Chloroflexi bacterium]|nr:CPBP family intramembrane metalloprotease [Chloroflexota bacterium]
MSQDPTPSTRHSALSARDRGRLRPTLRVVAFVPALVVANVAAGGLLLALVLVLGSPLALLQDPSLAFPLGMLVIVVGAVAEVGTVYAFRHLLDRASLASLGLQPARSWPRELLMGFLLGAALMSAVFAIEVLAGGYAIGPGRAAAGPGTVVAILGQALLTFLLVGLGEELVARGYVLQNLALEWGLPIAVVASSVLFGAAHLANPGANLVSTLGVTVAGLLLAASYLATRRLWMPIGLHWAWNFFQGPIYGFAVSGLAGQGLLEARAQGPEWLTGGAFGPEASVVAITVELVATAGLLAWAAQRARRTG